MEFIEANPPPKMCRTCKEPECDVCDCGLDRWLLPPEIERELMERCKQQKKRLRGETL